MDPLTKKI